MTSNPFVNTTSGLSPNAGVVGTPGAITAFSSTSQAVTTGTLQFQVPPQAAWAPGMFISAVSESAPSNFMTGTVTSYSGTTLTVDILSTGGAGTYVDWQINLAGSVGPVGPAGAAGAAGTNGTNAGPVNGSAVGLVVTNDSGTPNTKIDVTAISAVMINSSGASVRTAAPSVVIDLTTGTSTSAANGMDGHARGTSAWIYCYLINNGTTTSGLATLNSPTANPPTLPSGYTSALYVGAMYVDASGNLMRTKQRGARGHYLVTASTNTTALPAAITGSSGSLTTPTWTAQSIAALVPPTADKINIVGFAPSGSGVMVAPNNAYGAYNSTSNPPPLVLDGTFTGAVMEEITLEGTSIYYAANSASAGAVVDGWTDYCVAA